MVKASPPQSTVSPSNQAIYTHITTAFVIILLQIIIIRVYSYNLLVKSFSIKEKINQNEKQRGVLNFSANNNNKILFVYFTCKILYFLPIRYYYFFNVKNKLKVFYSIKYGPERSKWSGCDNRLGPWTIKRRRQKKNKNKLKRNYYFK